MVKGSIRISTEFEGRKRIRGNEVISIKYRGDQIMGEYRVNGGVQELIKELG